MKRIARGAGILLGMQPEEISTLPWELTSDPEVKLPNIYMGLAAIIPWKLERVI